MGSTEKNKRALYVFGTMEINFELNPNKNTKHNFIDDKKIHQKCSLWRVRAVHFRSERINTTARI